MIAVRIIPNDDELGGIASRSVSAEGDRLRRDGRIERSVGIGLAAGRIAIGAGLWVAPQLSAKVLGFGGVDQKTLAISRIAATRDLALGAWQLRSMRDPDQLRRATATIAAVDAGDALTFALALRAGGEVRTAGLRGFPGAAAATLAGAWLACRLGAR
jgi:hypothetical protein